jgi:tetratricopeptide (TPR) repeat protein
VADLTSQADTLYRTGQLRRALVLYRQGQMLDPECAICLSRIDKLGAEISERIDVLYGDGVRYMGAFQYEQAVQAFQTVLLLATPESSLYVRAEEKLREAQQKLGRPF